jgi:hypothetical protein
LPARRAALGSRLALDLLRLPAGGRSIAAASPSAASPATPATASLLVGCGWPAGFSAGRFPRPLRARGDRHDSGQPARTAPPAGLLAGARIHLFDPLVELGQPLFHRPLDLWAWGARLLGPNARPFGADSFRRGVSVGRLGLDRDFRREFRHLQKS